MAKKKIHPPGWFTGFYFDIDDINKTQCPIGLVCLFFIMLFGISIYTNNQLQTIQQSRDYIIQSLDLVDHVKIFNKNISSPNSSTLLHVAKLYKNLDITASFKSFKYRSIEKSNSSK